MPVALVTLSTPDQVNALDVSGSEGGAEARWGLALLGLTLY